MAPVFVSPEGGPKCKCGVEPVLPPDGMRRPPELGIGQAQRGRRLPQGIDAARRVP